MNVGKVLSIAKKKGVLGGLAHGALTLLIGEMTPEKKEQASKILSHLEEIGIKALGEAAESAAKGATEGLGEKLSEKI